MNLNGNVPAERELALCEFLRANVLEEDLELRPTTRLNDIGVDSFSYVEILLFVEREWGVKIPLEMLNKTNTASVSAIVACVGLCEVEQLDKAQETKANKVV